MPKGWSKGLTKETHPAIRRRSRTMKRKKIDNFSLWRKKMKRLGKIPNDYPPLPRNGDLAELIGVVLGDGHIQKFPRTDRLLIFSNSSNGGFIKRYAKMVEVFFNKKPTVDKMSTAQCVRIGIYQKEIHTRLGIPYSPRKDKRMSIPKWIFENKKYLIQYLRGLYEAEGSYSYHARTYTYKFSFSNANQSLLKNVEKSLRVLGFSPHRDRSRVQISRKDDVARAITLLNFRKYE